MSSAPAESDRRRALALGALATVLYLATAPGVVNLDGLGYLKQLPHNFAAGHLLYLPLVRAVTARVGDALAAGRLVDAVCGGLAVGLCFAVARALLSRRAAALAAAGFAVSYGVWVQGSDVEAYAPALLASLAVLALALAYRRSPVTETAVGLGLALGIAVLTHLTHVFATPFVALWISRFAPSRRRALVDGAVAVGLGGAVSLGAYTWAATEVRGLDLAGMMRWVATAGHGFGYQGGPLGRLADSIYGLSRALVWSPYLYESNAQTLLAQFLLGLGAVALLAGAAIAARRRLPDAAPLLGLWIASYAAVALAFFGSDHERWLFVLAPLWLLGAGALAGTARGTLALGAAIAVIAWANATSAIVPAETASWDRTRADAAAEVMREGDLVVLPGHAWDEYVGFYTHVNVRLMPLAYYAGLAGKEGCAERLAREIDAARDRGGRVFVVRILDDDGDPRGWWELEHLGLGRDALRAMLGRWKAERLHTSQEKVTVWRLD